MNPEIKAKWIVALRSGKYKQGRQRLTNKNNEYCCLGILCELAVAADVIPPAKNEEHGKVYCDRRAILPVEVMSWAGLDDANPDVDGIPLGERNDGAYDIPAHTFPQIADLIEKHL